MPDLILGSTKVISESSGQAIIQNGTKFPPGHIIQT